MRIAHVLCAAAAAALAVLFAAGCHDLPDLGTCGNGIVEEANGEACDDPRDHDACTDKCELQCASRALTASYVDVKDGDDQESKFCPSDAFKCGSDNICRAPSGFFEKLGPALPFNIGDAPTTGDVDNDGLPDLVGASATNIYIRFASTTGVPLDQVVVQEAPSSDAAPLIFDPRPNERNDVRSDLLFAIPTEGVALLQSDNERFAPELELPIGIDLDAIGVVVRDPDPVLDLGDVVVSVARASPSPTITLGRVPVLKPSRDPLNPAVPGMPLPACAGSGTGPWALLHIEPAADRRSFVIVTQRVAGGAWHVCRYTHAGSAWSRADLDFPAPAVVPLETRLANLDSDPCLELAIRSGSQILRIDAAEPTCNFVPGATALPFAVPPTKLLAAGPLSSGGIDELVLESGVFQTCTGPEDCRGASPGTFVRTAAPTGAGWSAAAVADLNGDDVLDAVAARAPEADVDVVRGGAIPNVYRATTSAPIRTMVAGDFDGDRLEDMAMAEMSPAGDRVVVLFGTREATVDVPRAMSGPSGMGFELRLDRFQKMAWITSTRGTDGIDDLGVVRVKSMDAQEQIRSGFAFGDAARLMTTPRFPPTAAAAVSLSALAAGAFRGPGVELLAVTGNQVLFYPAADLMNAMWSQPVATSLALHNPMTALRGPAPVRGVASLDGRSLVVFSVVGGAPREVCTAQAAQVSLRELRGVDVDGDDIDEVVVVSDAGDPSTRTVQILRAADCQPVPGDPFVGCTDVANVGSSVVAVCRRDGGVKGPVRGVFAIGIGTGIGTGIENERKLIEDFDAGDARFVTPGDYDGDGVLDVAVSVHLIDEIVVRYLRQCPAHDTRRCPSPARQ
ncbi:MAG TPA: hypothetical protein VNO30_11940 [Kofleriaceae bacterium]|nr:hypothetical protein [Kofleriaceae bacterium]